MNPAHPDDEQIEDLAAMWLAQRAEGLSPAQTREFEHWCRRDRRHAAAVARLEEACALLEKMPLVREELLPVVEFPSESRPAHRPAEPVRRFAWARLVAGFAAVLAVAAFGAWQWSRIAPAGSQYATTAGGFERVVLPDGSVVELNSNTQVRVEFAARERHVTLVAGEAHFSVAHDKARPFIVSVGGVSVRAVGTAFNVRLASSAVEVLVTEGRVAVVADDPPENKNDPASPIPAAVGSDAKVASPGGITEVAANERLSVSTAPLLRTGPAASPPLVEKVAPELVRAALSWQEKKLVFAETPLREVIAQFNRRNRLQIVLSDDSLAERPVGGTFAADNVDAFIRLLENSPAIQVERRSDSTVVLRAAR